MTIDVPRSLNQRVAAGFRAELARSGMSQPAFAKHLGISPGALRRRLNDQVSFKVDEVDVGCQLFEISTGELIRSSLALGALRIVAYGEVIVERQ